MRFKTSNKIFAHVDCDSFFSSCEVIKNPKLKWKKVVVGNEIVIACSYEAKSLWVKTWTPMWEAKKILWNNTYYFPPNIWYYQMISKKLMDYLRYNTLSIEEFSIDEAFCEITGLAEMNKLSLEEYTKKLQLDILKKLSIPVSIWVSNTRIKAKIFSKINKPLWYYISLNSKNDKILFKSLNISQIPYIWSKYQERLKYKSNNIYDFIKIWYWDLKKIIWKNATDLWLELVGINAFKVNSKKEVQSMSRGRSFNKNITNDKVFLYSQLLENFNYLFEELIDKNLEMKKIWIFFRNKQLITTIYEYNFNNYTTIRKEILKVIELLFNEHYNKNQLYRSTWIVFNNFRSYKPFQLNIFTKELKYNNNNLSLIKTVNKLNEKYWNHKISFWFSLLNKNKWIKLWIKKN